MCWVGRTLNPGCSLAHSAYVFTVYCIVLQCIALFAVRCVCRWYELYEEASASSEALLQPNQPVSNFSPSSAVVSSPFASHHELTMAVAPAVRPPAADAIPLMRSPPPNHGSGASTGSYRPVRPWQVPSMQHVYSPYAYVHPMAAANRPGNSRARPNFPFRTAPMPQRNPPVHHSRRPYRCQYVASAGGLTVPSVAGAPPTSPSVAMAPNSPGVYHARVRPPRDQFSYHDATMSNMSVPPLSSSYGMEFGVEPAGMNMAMQQRRQPVDDVVSVGDIRINYLLAAFRVGMLAMETLAKRKRVDDDRPHDKYGRNPPHGEEVKWLLGVSCRLGINFLLFLHV